MIAVEACRASQADETKAPERNKTNEHFYCNPQHYTLQGWLHARENACFPADSPTHPLEPPPCPDFLTV
jgi:hypothetical protein